MLLRPELVRCLICGVLASSGAAAAGASFEAAPAPAQTVPRPLDGETVAANPPCFVYPAARHCASYVVQYSRAAEFAPRATHTLAGRWMLNVPQHPLEPGRWYWRWRPGSSGDSGSEWSAVRSFVVPEDAPVVPFPDIPTLVRRIGASHPRVFVTGDSLAEVRRRALALNGAAWLERVQRYAKQAGAKKLLPEPDFLPDWQHGRLEKYAETFKTYRPFFAEMTHLAQEYLLTGNELSGQEARRRLMSIVAWDPNGSTSLHHNDEVGTDVVRHCPRAYDWIYPLLSAAERRKCLDVFRVRMQEMYETIGKLPFEKHPYESHRMGYYLPDLLQACLAVSGDMDVAEMLHYTMLQLWSPFYPPYGDADGGWNEGPSYWSWIAGVCAHTYRLVERATGVPVYEHSYLRNQAFYKLYGNPPWFKMSPFGDGQEGPARGGEAMLMLASLYQNPYARWYAEQLHTRLSDFDQLLFPADAVPARPPLDLPQGRCFFDVGLTCSHTNLARGDNDVAFLLRSSPFGGYGHAYADQNTFVLDAFGEPLIIASGYYQLYGCKHHTQWTWQTKASNSILVDGKGQPRNWNAKGRIAEFATLVAADYMVGDAHAAYPGVLDRYDRQALLLRPLHTGGDAVIMIHDRIQAKAPSKFQFLLHALDRMQVDEPQQVVRIRHGRAACRVDFLVPAPLEFRQTDQFTVPPPRPAPNQWHLEAGTTTNAKSATSMIVLQPAGRADEPALPRPESTETDAAFGVTLNRGNRRLAAVFRKAGVRATFAASGIRTDGQAASIAWIDGQPHSAVVVGGTFAAVGGGPVLLRAEAPVTMSASLNGVGMVLETAASAPVAVTVQAPFPVSRAVDYAGTPVSFQPGPEPKTVRLTLPPRRVVRLEPKRVANPAPSGAAKL